LDRSNSHRRWSSSVK
jgi:hypothetical protein